MIYSILVLIGMILFIELSIFIFLLLTTGFRIGDEYKYKLDDGSTVIIRVCDIDDEHLEHCPVCGKPANITYKCGSIIISCENKCIKLNKKVPIFHKKEELQYKRELIKRWNDGFEFKREDNKGE